MQVQIDRHRRHLGPGVSDHTVGENEEPRHASERGDLCCIKRRCRGVALENNQRGCVQEEHGAEQVANGDKRIDLQDGKPRGSEGARNGPRRHQSKGDEQRSYRENLERHPLGHCSLDALPFPLKARQGGNRDPCSRGTHEAQLLHDPDGKRHVANACGPHKASHNHRIDEAAQLLHPKRHGVRGAIAQHLPDERHVPHEPWPVPRAECHEQMQAELRPPAGNGRTHLPPPKGETEGNAVVGENARDLDDGDAPIIEAMFETRDGHLREMHHRQASEQCHDGGPEAG